MGLKLYSCLILHFWVFVILCMRAHCVSSEVYVKFLEKPREFSNLTLATFAFQVLVDAFANDQGNCTNQNQTANCKLNDDIPSDCEGGEVFYTGLQDGDHTFEVCTNGTQGGGCAHYNWTIDTVPPTANITAVTSFTNAPNVSVNISFSEPCTGFGCSSTNSCNLLVDGDGQVIPTTLSILQPNLTYSLTVNLSSDVQYGQVALVMDTECCTDKAGNRFTRTPNSTFNVNFDRRSGLVEVRTEIPKLVIQLNNETRTVQATNSLRNLKYHLNFSEAVLNTSAEVLNSLNITQGSLTIIRSTLDNRSFEFQVENIPSMAIVTVSLNSSLIATRRGTPVSPVAPVTFLYDTQRLVVELTTASPRRTTENSIPIRIEFTKPPLFGFNSSAINYTGGKLQSFEKVSSCVYYAKIQADAHVINVSVPENVVEDIAGNKNLASTVLVVKHYSVPLSSTVLSTTATTAFAATSLVVGLLTVSTASLQTILPYSIPPLPTMSNPAGNIFRTLGHIQVFALSRWISNTLPIEYDEFARGLQWSIPYFSLPWESRHTPPQDMLNSSSPPNLHSYGSKISDLVFFKSIQSEQEHLQVATTENAPPLTSDEVRSNFKPRRIRNSNANCSYSNTQDSKSESEDSESESESESESKSKSKSKSKSESKGWKDFKRSMFWLAVIVGSSILLHAIVILILKLRKNKKNSDKQEKQASSGVKQESSGEKQKQESSGVKQENSGEKQESSGQKQKQESSGEKQESSGVKQESSKEKQESSGEKQKQESSGVKQKQESSGEKQKQESSGEKQKQESSGEKQESSGVKQESSGVKQESSGEKQESSGEKQESSGVKQENSGVKQESSGEKQKQESSGEKQESSGVKQESSGEKQESSGVKQKQESSGVKQKQESFGEKQESFGEKRKQESFGEKQKQESSGVITFPRFGISFILVSLPCICEASASVVKGGSPSGIAIGTILLCIVSFLVLALFLFLLIGVTFGKLLQYKEKVKEEGQKFRQYVRVAVGPGKESRWTWWNEETESVPLTILGPVFEDLRGPPRHSQITEGNPPEQRGGGNTFVDETKDAAPNQLGGNTFFEALYIQKLFGILRIYYMLVATVRQLSLGVSAGAYPDKCSTNIPTILLLCMSSFQLFFLVLNKPYIMRRNQLVELIAVCSEVSIFATILVVLENRDFSDKKTKGIGIFMLILFLVAFLAQMILQCYALYEYIKTMDTKNGSFLVGLRIASFGLLLFFLPYNFVKSLCGDIPKELISEDEDGVTKQLCCGLEF